MSFLDPNAIFNAAKQLNISLGCEKFLISEASHPTNAACADNGQSSPQTRPCLIKIDHSSIESDILSEEWLDKNVPSTQMHMWAQADQKLRSTTLGAALASYKGDHEKFPSGFMAAGPVPSQCLDNFNKLININKFSIAESYNVDILAQCSSLVISDGGFASGMRVNSEHHTCFAYLLPTSSPGSFIWFLSPHTGQNMSVQSTNAISLSEMSSHFHQILLFHQRAGEIMVIPSGYMFQFISCSQSINISLMSLPLFDRPHSADPSPHDARNNRKRSRANSADSSCSIDYSASKRAKTGESIESAPVASSKMSTDQLLGEEEEPIEAASAPLIQQQPIQLVESIQENSIAYIPAPEVAPEEKPGPESSIMETAPLDSSLREEDPLIDIEIEESSTSETRRTTFVPPRAPPLKLARLDDFFKYPEAGKKTPPLRFGPDDDDVKHIPSAKRKKVAEVPPEPDTQGLSPVRVGPFSLFNLVVRMLHEAGPSGLATASMALFLAQADKRLILALPPKVTALDAILYSIAILHHISGLVVPLDPPQCVTWRLAKSYRKSDLIALETLFWYLLSRHEGGAFLEVLTSRVAQPKPSLKDYLPAPLPPVTPLQGQLLNDFRRQETTRFSAKRSGKSFEYQLSNGRRVRVPGVVADSPSRVPSLAALIVDAVARAPCGIASLADILNLLSDSQHGSTCTSDSVLVESTLHTLARHPEDTPVLFCGELQLWVYRYRQRLLMDLDPADLQLPPALPVPQLYASTTRRPAFRVIWWAPSGCRRPNFSFLPPRRVLKETPKQEIVYQLVRNTHRTGKEAVDVIALKKHTAAPRPKASRMSRSLLTTDEHLPLASSVESIPVKRSRRAIFFPDRADVEVFRSSATDPCFLPDHTRLPIEVEELGFHAMVSPAFESVTRFSPVSPLYAGEMWWDAVVSSVIAKYDSAIQLTEARNVRTSVRAASRSVRSQAPWWRSESHSTPDVGHQPMEIDQSEVDITIAPKSMSVEDMIDPVSYADLELTHIDNPWNTHAGPQPSVESMCLIDLPTPIGYIHFLQDLEKAVEEFLYYKDWRTEPGVSFAEKKSRTNTKDDPEHIWQAYLLADPMRMHQLLGSSILPCHSVESHRRLISSSIFHQTIPDPERVLLPWSTQDRVAEFGRMRVANASWEATFFEGLYDEAVPAVEEKLFNKLEKPKSNHKHSKPPVRKRKANSTDEPDSDSSDANVDIDIETINIKTTSSTEKKRKRDSLPDAAPTPTAAPLVSSDGLSSHQRRAMFGAVHAEALARSQMYEKSRERRRGTAILGPESAPRSAARVVLVYFRSRPVWPVVLLTKDAKHQYGLHQYPGGEYVWPFNGSNFFGSQQPWADHNRIDSLIWLEQLDELIEMKRKIEDICSDLEAEKFLQANKEAWLLALQQARAFLLANYVQMDANSVKEPERFGNLPRQLPGVPQVMNDADPADHVPAQVDPKPPKKVASKKKGGKRGTEKKDAALAAPASDLAAVASETSATHVAPEITIPHENVVASPEQVPVPQPVDGPEAIPEASAAVPTTQAEPPKGKANSEGGSATKKSVAPKKEEMNAAPPMQEASKLENELQSEKTPEPEVPANPDAPPKPKKLSSKERFKLPRSHVPSEFLRRASAKKAEALISKNH